jgi:hypothetical protein
MPMLYTMEIYKTDRRSKAGERLCGKYEYDRPDLDAMQREVRELNSTYPATQGYRFEIRETLITRKNLLTGQEFQERYDRPYHCSPASESYWSA